MVPQAGGLHLSSESFTIAANVRIVAPVAILSMT
jgi:hypothetical protein